MLAIGHVDERAAPWVKVAGGQRRLVHADIEAGVWCLGVRFEPGIAIERHRHTGRVFAWTISGCWMYEEYGQRYEAGSYVFEPAGSVHTLTVPADAGPITEVYFTIEGANLILDAAGNVVRINDAAAMTDRYARLCAEQGFDTPAFLTGRS